MIPRGSSTEPMRLALKLEPVSIHRSVGPTLPRSSLPLVLSEGVSVVGVEVACERVLGILTICFDC